ncbi:MAG TPA: thiamine phosphate synthase [Sulfuricella sp.]|nr:thiamine phosphate synthase [Sulfuricella sp.]
MTSPISGLYAITPECADTAQLLRMVEQALNGGARLVQYRSKQADAALRHEQASELLALCRRFHVPLIINDDLRLADLVGADGVHLGKGDGDIREARMILGPGKIIGVSCYGDLQLALDAETRGADYVAFGSFFPSPTKPGAIAAPLALLHEAKRSLSIPVVAIGGITPDNVGPLVEAGADAVAVISALFGDDDVQACAGRFSFLLEKSTHHTLH